VGDWQKEHDPNHEFRVTLIGHSMGAIVLNELIRTYDQIEYDDIVYMGAAASIRDLIRVVVPYLQRHPSARFYNLMLHPRIEAWELTWHGMVPSGSLLEWVDEMYEPPKTMLDRTLGKWRNLRLAKHLLDLDSQKQMVFKVFGGNADKPRMHGEFNDADTCFWNPWFWVDEDFVWTDWNTNRHDWEPPDKKSLSDCQIRMKDRMKEISAGE
jgi:pimeloyl-ACP methyl ester carboxylesterase